MGCKFHMMLSYLVLINFSTDWIQTLLLRWKKCGDRKSGYDSSHSMRLSWLAYGLLTNPRKYSKVTTMVFVGRFEVLNKLLF